jgi:hypothetical protein
MVLFGPVAGGVQVFSEDPQGLSALGPKRVRSHSDHTRPMTQLRRGPISQARVGRTRPLLRDRYIYFTARVKFSSRYIREDGSLLARDGDGRVLLADDGHTLNFDQHSRLREI